MGEDRRRDGHRITLEDRETLSATGVIEVLSFDETEDGIRFAVPPFSCHTVILIEYE